MDQAFKEKNQKEYDLAAQEAMKDLEIDYGDEQQVQKDEEQEEIAKAVKKQDSIVNLMSRGSFAGLLSSEKGLDQLIGASSALEMADDPEYLKHYSEKIAAEADTSDLQAKQQETQKLREQFEAEQARKHSVEDEDSVEHARALAAKLNAQLEQGVLEAEQLMEQKNKALQTK